MKTCSKCRKSKPLSNFWKKTAAKDGLDGWCIVCKKASTDPWRKTHHKQMTQTRKRWNRDHPVLVLAAKRRYRQRHPERSRRQVRNAHRKYGKRYRARRYFKLIEERHGLTKEQVQTRAKKQNHRCAICGQRQKCGKRRRLYVDHNHQTGKFRGLTCFSCNTLLGFARDSTRILRAAIRYLRRAK